MSVPRHRLAMPPTAIVQTRRVPITVPVQTAIFWVPITFVQVCRINKPSVCSKYHNRNVYYQLLSKQRERMLALKNIYLRN